MSIPHVCKHRNTVYFILWYYLVVVSQQQLLHFRFHSLHRLHSSGPKSCNGNPTAGLKEVIEITREFSLTQSEIYYDIEVEDRDYDAPNKTEEMAKTTKGNSEKFKDKWFFLFVLCLVIVVLVSLLLPISVS
jgi:hypothetical protein